jgi:glycosyltransferase involved in cell wall biosynthesis
MFVGLPCVASDLGGTREALGSPGAPRGWLAAPGDADDLASALVAVLEDPGAAARRGRRARAEARAKFTADRMVEGTLSVYGRLLSGG